MPDHGRPLSLALRPDLAVTRESFGERTFVVIKDPLALRYFRLREEEFAILELLDGRRSLVEIQTILAARFAPQKFPVESLSHFVTTMHQAGLVRSELDGQAAPLLERRRKELHRAWIQKLLSPTAIRIRGLDPTRLFDLMYPCVRWCYSRTTLIVASLLIAAALGLFAVYHVEVLRRLPTWQEFFTPGNLLLLLGLTAAIKVIHEFGHGLTCRHYGGEVHELGLMFLVFAPCLYCNVSDSWRLPKRARIAVSAAGIVVELVIASIATFGWWFSQPGLFQQLCLGAMFVSGVSTLLINGNPLMRYDGYFILADYWEVPNLAEKSAAVVRSWVASVCFGVAEQDDPLRPERNRGWLAVYAVASTLYRFVLTFSIMLFLMELARPYRLENLARLFALVALGGMIVPPLRRFYQFVRSHYMRADMQRLRIIGTSTAAAALAALFLFLPLPQLVWGTLEIEPRDVERVYVEVPGVIQRTTVRPGDAVVAGTILAKLENMDLELEIARLAGRAAEQKTELSALRQERFHSDSAARRIPELEQAVKAVAELLTEKQAEAARLQLRTSRAGVVLPPPETPTSRATAAGELPTWSGLPTDPENRGAALTAGTLYCQIGNPCEWQALVVIDQTDVPLLHLGQTVEIRFDEMPDVVVAARVDEISRRELSESPKRLSNKVGGELATKTDPAGVERPQSATYQVRVVLHDPRAVLRIGLRATARIHVAPEPLGTRTARWLARTFHFQL